VGVRPTVHAPCRIAARPVDREAFVISACMLKTHNTVIASLSIKNMVLGAPLHQATGESPRWSDKRKYHVGLRQTHYNMMVTAQRLNWGASLIDGYEGMDGNGPNSGSAVASRIALASTDYVAADRVAAETMGIDPEWLGCVKYCGDLGLGQFDPSKIRRHRREGRRRQEILPHAPRYRTRAQGAGSAYRAAVQSRLGAGAELPARGIVGRTPIGADLSQARVKTV
jgi:hypothetical protein